MTREVIEELVQKRLLELDKKFVHDKKYTTLLEFNKKYPVINSGNFTSIPIWEIIKYLVYFKTDIWSDFDEVSSKIDGFSSFFDDLSTNIISKTNPLANRLEILSMLSECDDASIVASYLKEKSSIKEKLLLKKLSPNFEDCGVPIDVLKTFKIELGISKIDIDALVEFFFVDKETLPFIDYMIHAYLFTRDYEVNMKTVEDTKKMTEEICRGMNASGYKKKAVSAMTNHLLETYKMKTVFGYFNQINNFLRSCERDESQFNKMNAKEKSALINALEMLDRDMKREEIPNASQYFKLIKNPEVRCAFMEFIYEHNSRYCDSLDEELSQLNKNSKVHYQALLREFGFDTDELNIEGIMNNDIDDVREMLRVLIRVFEFSNEVAFNILKVTDLERIYAICSLDGKGILTSAFIRTNSYLFDLADESFNILTSNVELIKSFNFNPSNFVSSIYVLLDNTGILKNNLEIIYNYDLFKYLKTTNNYSFLLSNGLSSKIDKILELGYENYLKEDLGILNYDTIDRLYVLKSLNIPVDSIDDFRKILTDRFYVDDSEISNCISNALDYNEKFTVTIPLDDLNTFKDTNRTYSIGGVKVSINKVNRLLEEGKSFYDAIFYGMILSDDEYQLVIDALKPYVKKKID